MLSKIMQSKGLAFHLAELGTHKWNFLYKKTFEGKNTMRLKRLYFGYIFNLRAPLMGLFSMFLLSVIIYFIF